MYGREMPGQSDGQLDGMLSLPFTGFFCDFATNCHDYWKMSHLSLMYDRPSTQQYRVNKERKRSASKAKSSRLAVCPIIVHE